MSNDTSTEPKKKGGFKKIILISVSVIILIGAGAGAGIYFGGLSATEKRPEDNFPKLVLRSAEAPVPVAGAKPEEIPLKVGTVSVPNDQFKVDSRKYEVTYYEVPDPFTTNLADGSGFLQIGVSLSTFYDGKVINNIQRQAVPIRSVVLMVLAEQDPGLLSTSHGKQNLQRQLTNAINDVLREKEGFGGIDNVYFTSMVIQ